MDVMNENILYVIQNSENKITIRSELPLDLLTSENKVIKVVTEGGGGGGPLTRKVSILRIFEEKVDNFNFI